MASLSVSLSQERKMEKEVLVAHGGCDMSLVGAVLTARSPLGGFRQVLVEMGPPQIEEF